MKRVKREGEEEKMKRVKREGEEEKKRKRVKIFR